MSKVLLDLKGNFTVVGIDFYGECRPEYFVFYANEFSKDQIIDLYEDYDSEENDFEGTFEDYLQELGIKYSRLK